MVNEEIEMLYPTISMPVTVALFDLDETDIMDEGGDENGVSVSTVEQEET
jgi:hypothetical protein